MQRTLRITAAAFLLLATVLVPSATVGAQIDECNDLIDLFGVDDPDTLRAAIDEAEAETGIDFHVFATNTLAAGQDLDAASFANCSVSYIVPGEVADDTVVLAVSVETRDFNVVYGENLRSRLDDDVDVIFERMAAWFQNGDFGRGLTAGVDEAAAGLATTAVVEESSENASSVPPPPPSGSSSGSSSALGWVAGGVGLVAAVGAGGTAVTAVRRKNQREREAAAAEYDKASAEVTNVQARWYDAEQSATFLAGRLTGSSMDRLDAAQDDAAIASRRLYDAWSPVSELDGTKVSELDDAARAQAFSHMHAAGEIAKENTEALQKFETALASLDTSVDQMGVLHTTATDRIASGRQAAAVRSGEGWDVATAEGRLTELEKALGHIDAFALRIDVDTMKPALEPLAKEADSIATDLEGLDELRDTTTARRTTVESDASGQLNRVRDAQTMIDGWKAAHAAQSFDEVLGFPAEASKQLKRAQEHLREAGAVGAIPSNVGVLRDVIADLDAADIAIDLADELLDDIDALDIDLTAAREDAPTAVADAQTDANTLKDYVTANRFDLAPPAHDVAQRIASDAAEAEAALGQSPPDYLLALELSEDVGDDVAEQLAKFQAAVAERERVRSVAQTQLRSARTAIERADRHIDSHMFSGSHAKNGQAQINALRAEYNQLIESAATNPERVTQRAGEMANIADQLYSEAQQRQRNSRSGGVGFGGGGYNAGRSRSRSRSSHSRSSSRSRSSGRSSSRRSSSAGRSRSSGGRRGKF